MFHNIYHQIYRQYFHDLKVNMMIILAGPDPPQEPKVDQDENLISLVEQGGVPQEGFDGKQPVTSTPYVSKAPDPEKASLASSVR